jgi:hypothetical protein
MTRKPGDVGVRRRHCLPARGFGLQEVSWSPSLFSLLLSASWRQVPCPQREVSTTVPDDTGRAVTLSSPAATDSSLHSHG